MSVDATKARVRRLITAGACLMALTGTETALAGDDSVDVAADWTDESSWDIPGEYVVDFDDDVSESEIGDTLSSLGLSFTETQLEDDTRIEVVRVKPGTRDGGVLAEALRRLRGDDRVERIEPHARVRAMWTPSDPLYETKQWHLTRIGTERSWELSVGRGVTVAVIDTGVACEDGGGFHKATDLFQTTCVGGYNFVDKSTHAYDDNGHGTHVAGTVAQSTNNALGGAGVAFGANLMPVKVLTGGGWGNTTDVADGIRWAADNGAQVINLSLGGPRNSKVLQSAVDHARSKGVVVVAAAGNNAGRVGYPGASEGVIGVSATDEKDRLAWFSSRGKGVDIAAPGVNVTQQTICESGKNKCVVFSTFNGTSMASPHVAGAAAALIGLGVTDADAVEQTLYDNAEKIDDSAGGRKKYGNGLLNVEKTVEKTWRGQLYTRFAALLVLGLLAFRWAKKRGGAVAKSSPGYWFGSLGAGVGLLFFAPFFMSRDALWLDVLSRPLGDWSLVLLGAEVHGWLPFANLLLPLGLAALFMRTRLAPMIAGLSVGTAAYLTSIAVLGQVATPFGSALTILWCVANALGCVYLASLLLQRKSA